MYICWIDGSVRRNYELLEGETSIGRRPDCDIVVMNSQVSRRHAQITGVSGTFTVADLGSANGTYVNGVRVSEQVRRRQTASNWARIAFLSCSLRIPRNFPAMMRSPLNARWAD